MKRITIHVATKDRHSEVALLVQSLREQTFQDWDLIVLDDASGKPLQNCYFFMALVNRLQLEGHGVKLYRENISKGVCYARNKLIEIDTFDNPLVCRLDDDCIPEKDYLFKLVEALFIGGYDGVSGVIPLVAQPEFKRQLKNVYPVINEHVIDLDGNIVVNKDDCGYCYIDDDVIPTHQFRTNLLYKKEITDAGVRYPDYLTKIGFREEGFFSFAAQMKGFKLAVRTGAVAYHLQCPSGGCRSPTYAQDVALDDNTFRTWVKTNYLVKGDFLTKVVGDL